ncbi:19521_t:CDS:2, partial [Racocetra fulgida]
KSSPESQSSNIPIKPHNYKKDCLLSVDNASLEPFSPRTQSMIDELEQHVDELANSNDQISIIDSPREVLTKSDVILESNSIPLNINIQKDDIWQYFNSVNQNFNTKKSIRLMIGLTTYHTKPSTSLEDQLKKSFLFPFNYHSLIFDTMKLVIYEYGSFLNKKRKYGRVIVRLNALKQTIINHGEFEKIFPIEANLHEIGAVQVNIKLHFPNDPPFSPQTLSSSIQSPLIQNTRDYFDDSIETQSDAISLGIL